VGMRAMTGHGNDDSYPSLKPAAPGRSVSDVP
jgi:hypothetical protein